MAGRLQLKYLISLTLSISLVIFSCHYKKELSNNEKYIIQAFDSIQVYSRHRNSFNLLDSLETQVLISITDSTSNEEVILLLEEAIKFIDKHNYILTAEKVQQMETGTTPDVFINPYPFQYEILNKNHAYVSLSGFLGVDSISAKNYTDSLQRSLLWLYNQQPKGWIIDLRNNSGGWPYPMLAGLGPLLGPGVKALDLSDNGVINEYYFFKDSSNYILLSDSIWFFEKQLPVAVLISEKTGSAGELLALSFRGNPMTSLIGMPTFGVSTSLTGFLMPDGTQICVTSSIMTDRNKNGDGGKIQPDIIESDPIKIFEKAYNWIENNE